MSLRTQSDYDRIMPSLTSPLSTLFSVRSFPFHTSFYSLSSYSLSISPSFLSQFFPLILSISHPILSQFPIHSLSRPCSLYFSSYSLIISSPFLSRFPLLFSHNFSLLFSHDFPFLILLRLKQLVKAEPSATYVDLVTTFADEDDNEVNGPDVRYFLTSE